MVLGLRSFVVLVPNFPQHQTVPVDRVAQVVMSPAETVVALEIPTTLTGAEEED
jgi:hypothetical protein